MSPTDIAKKYIDAINSHNASSLSSFMTGGHSATLPDGTTGNGKDAATRKWKEFFNTYKDYKLQLNRVTESNGVVTMSGNATCLLDKVAGFTNITVTVESGKIASLSF